jgi:hypothetical protein
MSGDISAVLSGLAGTSKNYILDLLRLEWRACEHLPHE